MSFYLFNELFMKNCCQSEFIVENKYLRSPRKRKLFFFQSSLLSVSNLKPFGRVIMPLGKLQKNLITFMFPLLFISTKNLCKYHPLECSSSDKIYPRHCLSSTFLSAWNRNSQTTKISLGMLKRQAVFRKILFVFSFLYQRPLHCNLPDVLMYW